MCYDFLLLESGSNSCHILHFELLTSEIHNMKFRYNIYILIVNVVVKSSSFISVNGDNHQTGEIKGIVVPQPMF